MTHKRHAARKAYSEGDFKPWLTVDSGPVERILRVFTHWWWDHVYCLKAEGVENIPAEGAFILVPNHSSYADPFIITRPQARALRFMAKDSMFTWPIAGRLVKAGGGFPVRRGQGDGFAMELAGRLLAAGYPVVIYPEGTRFRESAELGPARRGFARLALEHGVPVVPAAAWGIKKRSVYGRPWWRRPKTSVVYGKALQFEALQPTPETAALVRDQVWDCVQAAYDRARELGEERSAHVGWRRHILR